MTEENTQNSNPSPVIDELTLLKSRADTMGVEYHHKIGIDKLRKLVNDKLGVTPDKQDEVTMARANNIKAETPEAIMRRNANKLIRIRVTCMNPNKTEHPGEIFTTGNPIVGTIKKYVPFNNDEGWHVPKMIYDMMVEKQCQIFYTVKAPNGQKIRKGKLIKEFAIEVLPNLTTDEISDLAKRQALNHSIDG